MSRDSVQVLVDSARVGTLGPNNCGKRRLTIRNKPPTACLRRYAPTGSTPSRAWYAS